MIGLVNKEDLHSSVGHVVTTRVDFPQLTVGNLDVGGISCTAGTGGGIMGVVNNPPNN